MQRKGIRWTLLSLLIGLSLTLAACGAAVETATESPITTPVGGGSPGNVEKGPTQVPIPSGAEELVDLVRQDLAERLGIAKDQIRMVSVESVEWGNSGLGCPKPGMGYLDVMTPGYAIVLRAAGQEWDYHTGPDQFVLCHAETEEKLVEQPRAAEPMVSDAKTADLVEEAKADLSMRLNISTADIVLQWAGAVEWPDSSIGCPEPGMNYLMVVTPGYLIKLEAKGRIYQYHAGENSPFYCENPQEPLNSSDPQEKRIVEIAKADLAKRLNVAESEISLVRVKAVDWPDTSMGCPQPGMMYAQMITPGYHIILSAGGQEYDYRGSLKTATLCEQ